MRQIIRYLSLLSIIIATSCVITDTPGFYNGYKKLNLHEKEQVIFLNDSLGLAEIDNTGKVVIVNGTQLQKYASKSDSLLVYVWAPNCASEGCVLISACQDYCDYHNYDLAVVAEYYDMQIMYAQNTLDLPILIANHIYYGKYFANSLNRAFFKDLLSESNQEYDPTGGRFLLLANGKLVKQGSVLIKE